MYALFTSKPLEWGNGHRDIQARGIAKLADLEARMPKHSVSVAIMIELEELGEEVSRLREDLQDGSGRCGCYFRPHLRWLVPTAHCQVQRKAILLLTRAKSVVRKPGDLAWR